MRDITFLVIACLIHGAILSANPTIRWASMTPLPPKVISVEFVAMPPPTPMLAPVRGGSKSSSPDLMPKHGPGAYKPEQIKKPKTKFAAKRAQAGKKPTPKTDPKLLRLRALQREERERKLAQKRLQQQALKAAQQAMAREKAKELARLKAERERKIAEERAQRARKQAEISSELAAVADPDEKLSDAANDPPLADGAGAGAALAGMTNNTVSEGPQLGPGSGQVAALPGSSEPVYELEAEGHDNVNSRASGGGIGPGGGGSSWTLDGPAGNRRIIKRILPQSPDWITKRGLELSVQIKFQVLEDGTIKHGAVIRRTSGFPEIDQLALEAIKRWQFESIPAGPGTPQVWGTVTFRFLMG